ncbi:MAG: complex I NDUFA9 subunit family protein [bacterium]|nr:complex I NDUFA9 subunit family protein [bacterium]
MKVFVTGGSGYVGETLLHQLSEAGHEIRVLSRDPEPARQRLTSIRGVYPVGGDITQSSIDQLAALMKKCEAVIHLVGVIIEKGTGGFEAVHVEGTRRVVEAAKRAGVKRFVHMSALGTREGAVARYHKTKWAAEQIVRESGIAWTILRPSILFGEKDEFLNTFAGIARISPALPVIGSGKGKLQPIWVEDVCRCFTRALERPETGGKVFELGGEKAYALKEILRMLLRASGKKRLLIHLPVLLARLQAALFDVLPGKPPFTADQITMLGEDNVCDPGPMKAAFDLAPRSLEDYMEKSFGHAPA